MDAFALPTAVLGGGRERRGGKSTVTSTGGDPEAPTLVGLRRFAPSDERASLRHQHHQHHQYHPQQQQRQQQMRVFQRLTVDAELLGLVRLWTSGVADPGQPHADLVTAAACQLVVDGDDAATRPLLEAVAAAGRGWAAIAAAVERKVRAWIYTRDGGV
jgi:hypothetical protein